MQNKTKLIMRGLLGTAAALLLSSCASRNTLENRISHNPDAYNALPEKEKALIGQRKIAEGMSKDGVYFSWGAPAQRSEGSSGGTTKETWVYKGHQPVVQNHFGFGYGGYGRGYGGYGRGYGGHGCYSGYGRGSYFYGGPTVSYIPYTSAKVNFTNSRVTAWETVGR